MLFNLDKQTKQNILEHYRQEALKSRLKKEEEKKREIEEDRNNLELKEKRQKETIDIMNEEILFKRNQLKKEYNLMLQKTKGYIPRKTDIIINNWGQPKEPFILPELRINNSSQNKKFHDRSFLNYKYTKKDFALLSPMQKEKEILKQIDHMNEYLTDKENLKEVKQYFLMQKENRHNFYKDLLYNQYKNAINQNLNLYGTKDALIMSQRKKKFISDNPYIKKRKYDSGTSSLEHNPIINPENNYNYNKYIDYKNFALSLNKSRNNNKINNLNSFDNYLLNAQKNNLDYNNLNHNKLNKEINPYYRYENNNITNINSNLKESKTIDVNKNIIKNLNNSYYNLNCEKNINNNQAKRNNEQFDYNLRKNFSQGDIYA